MKLNIQRLIDKRQVLSNDSRPLLARKCRSLHCHATHVVKNGRSRPNGIANITWCREYGKAFDDLTKTVLWASLSLFAEILELSEFSSDSLYKKENNLMDLFGNRRFVT